MTTDQEKILASIDLSLRKIAMVMEEILALARRDAKDE